MREFRTSGSVRGEGGDILAYSARDFVDIALFVQMMKSRVGIGLQRTLKFGQMLPGMFALAIFRVSEPHGWSGLHASGAIVANIGPEHAGPGLAVAGSKHRNRRIIGMYLRCCQNMLADFIDQWS